MSTPGLIAKPWVRSIGYLFVGYVGMVAMLLFFENKLVYHPYTAEQDWVNAPHADIEDVYLTGADGTRVHAWYCHCPGSDEALLYCHGNAGNLSHRGGSILKIRALLNVSVLIIDYPGYGKSEGSPSEAGCYDAADASYVWLTDEKKFASKKILLYGASLGGGVITDLASRKEHRALVLIKTFTSLPDVASDLYWWLPVPKRAIMRNRFNSIDKLASCRRPVFIAHGTHDRLIPFAHGERLYEAANEPKRFFPIVGHGHNDPLPQPFFESLRSFLQEQPQ
ncbi:MAG TPA: alpha/beta hydrolase [Gemmataceae bacterium]|nr:alpha/beta hydrolase [Gemmataceae bacterium]